MQNEEADTFAQRITIKAGGKDIPITMDDAKQIRVALETYLTKSRDEIAETMPPNLMEGLPQESGAAWIDSDRVVRMSPWLLEGRANGLVLVYRVVPPGSYQYIARIEKHERSWRVLGVSYEKLLPRR